MIIAPIKSCCEQSVLFCIARNDHHGRAIRHGGRQFSFELPVESDDCHLIDLAGLPQRGPCTKRRRIVNRENSSEMLMSLQCISCGIGSFITQSATFKFCDNRDRPELTTFVVLFTIRQKIPAL